MNLPSEQDLIARLTTVEDSFTERKSKSDKGGWLQTAVAFANSAPIGYPAVLFVGVDNDGAIEDGCKVEELMKSFSDQIAAKTWPPVYTLPITISHQGRSCLAVIVPGSEARPHFAGKSYIRDGTQTKDASSSQFAELVAQHLGKPRELHQWIGKTVSVIKKVFDPNVRHPGKFNDEPQRDAIVEFCNPHYVTLKTPPTGEPFKSYPLHKIELGFDHDLNRLIIYDYETR